MYLLFVICYQFIVIVLKYDVLKYDQYMMFKIDFISFLDLITKDIKDNFL